MKVAVHVMAVELDACVTRVFGDGSRTWFGVVLASSDLPVSNPVTVAVHIVIVFGSSVEVLDASSGVVVHEGLDEST